MSSGSENSNKTSKKESFWLSSLGFVIVVLICIAVYVVGIASTIYLANHGFFGKLKSNEFGDTAGAVNCLFSSLAFAGVIYAILMQRNELELQRDELQHTRDELAGQKEEFRIQNETLKLQRFENTFFNMLQLQQQITDNISYSYVYKDNEWELQDDDLFPPKTACGKGREVFRDAFETAIHTTSKGKRCNGMRGLLLEEGIKGFENNFTPTYFDHYFRHLYRIFKFVSTSPLINDADRYQYASIARAQLSRYELVWLFYNGLSENGREKFKPLIEEFALLNNLREDLLVYKVVEKKTEYVVPLELYATGAYCHIKHD